MWFSNFGFSTLHGPDIATGEPGQWPFWACLRNPTINDS